MGNASKILKPRGSSGSVTSSPLSYPKAPEKPEITVPIHGEDVDTEPIQLRHRPPLSWTSPEVTPGVNEHKFTQLIEISASYGDAKEKRGFGKKYD
jgi:hypothetical protein